MMYEVQVYTNLISDECKELFANLESALAFVEFFVEKYSLTKQDGNYWLNPGDDTNPLIEVMLNDMSGEIIDSIYTAQQLAEQVSEGI